MYHFNSIHQALQTGLFVFSTVLAVLFAYFLFLYIAICCWIIYNRPEGENLEYEKKFGPIFEDYKTNNSCQRSFEIFFLVRKTTYIVFLLGFSSTARLQIPFIAINCFVTFISLALLRPYKERKNIIINLISEGVVSSLMICALVLLNDQTSGGWMSYSDKIIVGWITVGLCGVLILANIIFMLYESYKKYREWWQRIKKKYRD